MSVNRKITPAKLLPGLSYHQWHIVLDVGRELRVMVLGERSCHACTACWNPKAISQLQDRP
eukprot:1178088-Pleurochrysis_carterae.AAC.1